MGAISEQTDLVVGIYYIEMLMMIQNHIHYFITQALSAWTEKLYDIYKINIGVKLLTYIDTWMHRNMDT